MRAVLEINLVEISTYGCIEIRELVEIALERAVELKDRKAPKNI